MPVLLARRSLRFKRVMAACVRIVCGSLVLADATQAADLLPAFLESTRPGQGSRATRGWAINDVVQVSEILDVAVSEQTGKTAFIVKQAFVESGVTRFGLYVTDIQNGERPRKLLEGGYLADLSQHPDTSAWTVRADVGRGVQLYDVSQEGHVSPLVVTEVTADWGGEVSYQDVPHKVGVLSYEWAPDGSALWYSRPMVHPADTQLVGGVVFDGRTMSRRDLTRDQAQTTGRELHYANMRTGVDRTLVTITDVWSTWGLFRRGHSVAWRDGSRQLEYRRDDRKASGEVETTWWMVDVESGQSRLRASDHASTVPSMSNANAEGLSIVRRGNRNHLMQGGRDYGPVGFHRIGKVLAHADGRSASRTIIEVQYTTHSSIAILTPNRSVFELPYRESLSRCSFGQGSPVGACVRESLELAPEVVAITRAGRIAKILARPNARYDAIIPLVSQTAAWTNRYGNRSDGYITYPRGFVRGRRYPTIVITHGRDARNTFATQAFQWDFHAAVFAEHGYLVLSVNEPFESHAFRVSLQYRIDEALKQGPPATQFRIGLDAVATMEAALMSAQRLGIADVERAGIAGYSRGGEVVQYTMTQSTMFKAAALGEGYWGADAYWITGVNLGREFSRAVYGGSPYDSNPCVIANYRRFAVAFRADQFAGPLLTLTSAQAAVGVLELPRFLTDAGVPNELVFFRGEGHLFWNPRNRAAVMQRSLEWFDYWLRNARDSDAKKEAQYERWEAMAAQWSSIKAAPATRSESKLPSPQCQVELKLRPGETGSQSASIH